jgi:site-specific recombinase XerD
MGKIGFRIRSSVSAQVPVYVYVYRGSTIRQEVKTGLLVKRKSWNSELQRGVDHSIATAELNEKLNRLENHLLKELNNLSNKSGGIPNDWLLDHVNLCFYRVSITKSNMLLYQIEQYIELAPTKRVKRTGSIGLSTNTIRNLMRFYELIEAFEEYLGESIDLTKLDHTIVQKLQDWLLSVRGYSVNNAGLQLKLLKMVCKQAERNGVGVHSYTRHIESFSQRSKDRILQTLSFEEIELIKNLTGLPSTLENSRRWMLIGLFIGQRVSDLLKLTTQNFRNGEVGVYVDLLQQKTEKHVTIGVIDSVVIQILENYFPYAISAQQFNKQIKQICQIAGITEMVKGYKTCEKTRRRKLGVYPKYSLISSHDLRRSFATNYFGKIPTPILMQVTGHSKETTFLSYIGAQVNKDAYADAFIRVASTL